MVATDANALSAYRRARDRRGQMILIRRVTGNAPNAVTFDARISAIVMDYMPKGVVGTAQPEGGITLGGRNVIALADDLAAANFPLPVIKNDKVVLNAIEAQLGGGAAAGDEEMNIISADPNKRGLAGAIDIVAEGV